MSEFSFINFESTPTDTECEKAVPVCGIDELRFFFGYGNEPADDMPNEQRLQIVTPDTKKVIMHGDDMECNDNGYFHNDYNAYPFFTPLDTRLAIGDCFRLASLTGIEIDDSYKSVYTLSEEQDYFKTNKPIETIKVKTREMSIPESFYRNEKAIKQFTRFNSSISKIEITQATEYAIIQGTETIRDFYKYPYTLKFNKGYGEFVVSFEFQIPITKKENAVSWDAYIWSELDIISKKHFVYSNLLRYEPSDGLSLLEYWCDKSEFGFDYQDGNENGNRRNAVHVPIHLKAPQYKQKDKTYERLDGSKVVIYAEINKEYEAETDYISEQAHQNIIVALSHDHVKIDGEELQKTDNYEIDWDNTITSPCGEKLAKAKFKMTANIKQRNSNCI